MQPDSTSGVEILCWSTANASETRLGHHLCFVQSLVHVVEKLLRTSRSNRGWIKQEFYFFDTSVFSTVSFHFSWEALFPNPTSRYCFLLKCISLTTKKASGTSLKKEIIFLGKKLPTLKVHCSGMGKAFPGCETTTRMTWVFPKIMVSPNHPF